MAECAFHPGVETNVTCAECGRPICPKDMVLTSVGYKCPICAKPSAGQLAYVKPKQYLFAALAGLASGVGGGFLLAFVLGSFGRFLLLLMLLFGAAVGEAARRGSGGHRSTPVAAIAGVCAFLGGIVGGFSLLHAAAAAVGAVVAVASNRWG